MEVLERAEKFLVVSGESLMEKQSVRARPVGRGFIPGNQKPQSLSGFSFQRRFSPP
jgi:hypothetical protein